MAISFPLIMPTAVADLAAITWRRVEPQNMTVSPFTGIQQVQASQAQWWEADLTLPILTRAQADEWEAFLLSLGGSKGTFLLSDPEHRTPRGAVGTDTPQVRGDDNGGNTLDIKNCTPSVAGWGKAGDFFQLGAGGTARLYRLLQDVDTNGDGTANLTFWPSLRSIPSNDEPLVFVEAAGLFRLKPQSLEFNRVPLFTNISFTAVEALNGL